MTVKSRQFALDKMKLENYIDKTSVTSVPQVNHREALSILCITGPYEYHTDLNL